MSIHVIVLCQGSQSRLPHLTTAKQMLPLAACARTPVLIRTLTQLSHLCGAADESLKVDIVGWQPLIESVLLAPWRPGAGPLMLDFLTLPDPGNSSLKGAAYTLARRPLRNGGVPTSFDRTVILLGDVVYSWDCLRRALLVGGIHFLGTKDISPSGGELFAVCWNRADEVHMIGALEDALASHPKFSEYQPGQMRRWMTGGRPWSHVLPCGVAEWTSYSIIDDYTDDIDLPEDVANLDHLSELAARDDFDNGVRW